MCCLFTILLLFCRSRWSPILWTLHRTRCLTFHSFLPLKAIAGVNVVNRHRGDEYVGCSENIDIVISFFVQEGQPQGPPSIPHYPLPLHFWPLHDYAPRMCSAV